MIRCLILALLLALPALAADGDIVQKVPVDLDGDGRKETIALKAYTSTESGNEVERAQLVVLDARGKTIWSAAKKDPFVFGGELDLGELEAAGDLDGDGRVELIGTYQKGDVSPTRFRLFRWNGQEFVLVKRGRLVPLNQRPGTFVFSEDLGTSYWADRVLAIEKGRLKVRLMDSVSGARMPPSEVWLRVDGEEFVVTE
ncbi:MAG: hypothetical protein AB1758_10620 [Candidatus Eremiobacterota bacterium]